MAVKTTHLSLARSNYYSEPIPTFLIHISEICADVSDSFKNYTPPPFDKVALANGVIPAFQDIVHSLFNNACRLHGVEVEGNASEASFELCTTLGDHLEKWIIRGVETKKLEYENDLKQLKEAEAKVAYLRDKLNRR